MQVAPLFVYYYDLLKIYNNIRTLAGAHKRYKAIKEALGKKEHQYITLKEFADWNDVPETDVIRVLYPEAVAATA